MENLDGYIRCLLKDKTTQTDISGNSLGRVKVGKGVC